MSEIDSLKRKTFNGTVWNYINQFGTQVLAVIPAMVLARLLTPSEYGLIAMAGVFTGLISIFANAGFGMAVIQCKDLKHIDICSVFYCNIFMNTLVYLVIFIIAPFCADFFAMPEVKNIMRFSSLGLILSSFGTIHGNLFIRELDFRKPTIRNLTVQFLSATIAIILALSGFGYWALVVQGLAQASFSTITNWILSSWRPTLEFSMQSVRSLFGYGGKIMFKSLFEYCFAKSYDTTIGKFYSASQLSYYTRAYSTANIFISSFLGVLNTVAFSAFSKMQSDPERLCTNVRRFMAIEAMIMFFIMSLIAALAEPFFHFMYSSKWDEVIPLFQLVCVWGMLQPIGYVYGNGLLANGRVTECVYIGIVSRGLMFAIIFITWKYGILAMIAGQVFAYVIEVVICAFVFQRFFSFGVFDMVRIVSPYFLISVTVSALVYILDHFCIYYLLLFINNEMFNAIFRLLFSGIIGVTLYWLVNKKFCMRAYADFSEIVLDALKLKPSIYRIASKVL